MARSRRDDHNTKISIGMVLVALGALLTTTGDEVGLFGWAIALTGAVILLIGVVGAGVQAGNRDLVEAIERRRGLTDGSGRLEGVLSDDTQT